MWYRSLLAVSTFFAIAACGSSTAPFSPPSSPQNLSGVVTSAAGPVANSQVTLYRAGDGAPRSGASVLAHATTDAKGAFRINYTLPGDGVVYAVAIGGKTGGHSANAAIGLMGIAGRNGRYVGELTLNEFTTVADAFALAQFADSSGVEVGASGTNRTGIDNAARIALANLATTAGTPAAFWPGKQSCRAGSSQPDNCDGLERLNALANALGACTTSGSAASDGCRELFELTGRRSTTLAAIHSIVLNPARNVSELFALSRRSRGYSPATGDAPSAWFLALKYVGNGKEFDGPGLVAIDAAGNAWSNNNYAFKSDHSVPTCGGKQLLELTPTGSDAPGAPFSGGGVDGAGWGMVVDPGANLWVGNFGFSGKGCKNKPPANSVSEYHPSGHPVSPNRTGFTQGDISRPQATTFDQTGNLWIANYGGTTVTQYPGADPSRSRIFGHVGLKSPFAIAIDARGDAWITSSGNDSVVALRPDGRSLRGSPFTSGGIKRPLGGALDSRGNLWISNSTGNSVTALDAGGRPLSANAFTGGGVGHPWGIAVDGNDNVWVADFSGVRPRLSELCGVRHKGCAAGAKTGDPLSPQQGFASGLLQRQTGVTIDASGNAWVCNNWLPVPIQTNPGGDGLVVFVGIAGPVKTPLMGLPKQP